MSESLENHTNSQMCFVSRIRFFNPNSENIFTAFYSAQPQTAIPPSRPVRKWIAWLFLTLKMISQRFPSQQTTQTFTYLTMRSLALMQVYPLIARMCR